MKPPLSAEHRLALDAYKEKYGAMWKSKLMAAWRQGTDASEPQPMGSLLRQIRNIYGPVWLQNYKGD